MSSSVQPTARCLAVAVGSAVGLGAAVLATAPLAVAPLAQAVRSWTAGDPGGPDFADLLTALAAVALLLAELWLGLVVLACALEACGRARLRRVGRRLGAAGGCPPALRRVLLSLCGAALVAGTVTPAWASDPGPLPLPDRPAGRLGPPPANHPTSHPTSHPVSHRAGHRAGRQAVPRSPARTGSATAAAVAVVAPGDSLWRIAARTLPGAATPTAVDARWREIAALNVAQLRGDPDLIHPGQPLRLPDAGPSPAPPKETP